MILVLVLLLADSQPSNESLWLLRAGREAGGNPLEVASYLYTSAGEISISDIPFTAAADGIKGGDASMLVPLAASLVSRGETELAEICWGLRGMELPATRKDLLDALSWFGRYELYTQMAQNPAIPPDMEGKMHSDQCGAACALGWMRIRSDGMFHGDDVVSPFDVKVLSIYFPAVDASAEYITITELESIFQSSDGGFR